MITVLKSKIYRAYLTDVSINYSGSFGIDSQIMRQVNIFPYEKLLIININTGGRFETYCIAEPEGSGKFALYGGAARLGVKGDPVIILTFKHVSEEAASTHKPIVLNFE